MLFLVEKDSPEKPYVFKGIVKPYWITENKGLFSALQIHVK